MQTVNACCLQVCKVLKLYELARHLPECALSEFERPGYVEEGQRIMTALRYPVSHPPCDQSDPVSCDHGNSPGILMLP